MKVEHAQDNVRGSQGLGDTKSFTINTTAHAFKILSSGLYSDKFGAVLREIGCNAMDAHIEAGKRDVPFIVKLPNENDDQFYIQDFGPGLSHDDVMNLYSTYFASTKQTSNDFTGAFGLGSKSPFSYTDSISVVSCHGGKMRTYASYINNKGAPVTSLITEEDVAPEWPTGMRVGFSVRPGDYEDFQERAQTVYRWFKVTPNILGAPPIKKIYPQFSEGSFHTYEGVRGIHVLMGNVLYPVDTSKLGIEEPGYNWSDKSSRVPRNYIKCADDFVLHVNIGDVEVAASRETLQYTDETIKFLQDQFDKVVRRLATRVMEHVNDAWITNKWQAYADARRVVRETIGHYSGRLELLLRACNVADETKAKLAAELVSSAEVPFPKDCGRQAKVKLVALGRKSGTSVQHVTDGRGAFGEAATANRDKSIALVSLPDPIVVHRARAHVLAGHVDQLVVITGGKDRKSKVTDIEIAAEIALIQTKFGEIPTLRAGDLPEVTLVPRAKSKRKGKGWVPTLPTTKFTVRSVRGGSDRAETLGNLAHPVFAGVRVKSAWGRETIHYRRFLQPTAAEDSFFDQWHWSNRIVRPYELLLKGFGATVPNMPAEFAVLNSKEIKSSYVLELGWKPLHQAIADVLANPTLLDGLRALRRRTTPEVPSHVSSGLGCWISHLCVQAAHYRSDVPKWIIPHLERAGMWDTIEETIRNAKKKSSSSNQAAELANAYAELCRELDVKAEPIRAEEAVTLSDLDTLFAKKFPQSNFVNLMSALPDTSGRALVEHVLTMEVST